MSRELTEMQQNFVAHFTATDGAIGNAAEAARQAGYSEKTAREIGHRLVNKPHVRAAIREANQCLLSGEMATKARALLGKVLDDETVPIKIRVDAARTVLDRADFGAVPGSSVKRGSDKHPSEMNEAELLQHVIELRAMISAEHNKVPIDVTPQPQALPVPTLEGIEP